MPFAPSIGNFLNPKNRIFFYLHKIQPGHTTMRGMPRCLCYILRCFPAPWQAPFVLIQSPSFAGLH